MSAYALSVDYGQRHCAELDAAARVASALGAREHRIMRVDLAGIGGSALTDWTIAVPEQADDGIPVTYVPARNTMMLALALGWAEVLAATDIVIGVNAVDYSRLSRLPAGVHRGFEALAASPPRRASRARPCSIHAPLIALSKAEIIREGMRWGVDYALTVSCYQADAQGRACGRCDSCRLRRAGFEAAGVPDPTRYVPSGAAPPALGMMRPLP